MCLATKMSPKKKAEFKEQTEGWKVLWQEKDGTFVGECFSIKDVRPEGEWLNEEAYRPPKYHQPHFLNSQRYPHGWHIWLTLEGAGQWCLKSAGPCKIRKVQLKEPVAYGYQEDYPAVVAKEMMILKEGNRWN